MVDPSPDIDIAVDNEPLDLSVKILQEFHLDLTFDLWYMLPPLTGGSFSSWTDICSRRDSIALMAMVVEVWNE